MKNYFPFTDYDFYAYLTGGGLLLVALDYAFSNSTYLSHENWSFVQIMVAIASAHVAGHIVAMLAQTILETFVVSKVISKPISLQLGFVDPNWLEKITGALVGRYYSSFPETTRHRILEAAATELGKPVEEVTDAEDVFQIGFRKSFDVEGARSRIDDFRNQYGFCRNISFVALITTLLLIWKAWSDSGIQADWWLAVTGGLVFIGMFVRFVKFLSSFQAEVVRLVK
ncbi:MAG: hypothetical protein KZQ94_05820 [Candidatus Thiodiazotropha sp. (ex Troendleina suluensis)]|nr:hypothetical protein [Candidatus Thiodiazotropha sp. (ex Troendleina suluensis)]